MTQSGTSSYTESLFPAKTLRTPVLGSAADRAPVLGESQRGPRHWGRDTLHSGHMPLPQLPMQRWVPCGPGSS